MISHEGKWGAPCGDGRWVWPLRLLLRFRWHVVLLSPPADPLRPLPGAVGQCQDEERQHEAQHDQRHALGDLVGRPLAQGAFLQRFGELLGGGQPVVAPLVDDHAVAQQQQPGVAPYDGLERCPVGDVERVFCASDVAPVGYGLVLACRQGDEAVVVVLRVFVDAVDLAEIGGVGQFEVGGHEDESVALVGQHLLREVIVGCGICDGEIVDGGLVALLHLHGLAVDEGPGGVGVVVERKLLAHAALLQDECCLKLRLLGSCGDLHSLADVGSDMVGAEVEGRQIPKAQGRGDEDEEQRVVDDDPLVGLRDEAHHAERFPRHNRSHGEQQEVLQQRLAVGEVDGVAEASAVLDGLPAPKPHRDGGHDGHEGYDHAAHLSPSDGKEQEDAEAELHGGEQDARGERGPGGGVLLQVERFEVVADLVLGAQRVDGLDKAREDESQGERQAAEVDGHTPSPAGLLPLHGGLGLLVGCLVVVLLLFHTVCCVGFRQS
mgnify:FL=1